MSQLTDNLYSIASIKSDIKSAIEAKGVDMTGMSFPDYPGAIASISTAFVTETLSVSVNGTYTPSVGIDGFSQVTVNVPQSATGYTEKDFTEGTVININNSASYVSSYVFYYQKIQTINLPNCVDVGSSAFAYCSVLSTAYLPMCTHIGNGAFSVTSLNNIYIPQCTSIDGNAFRFTSLAVVDLPSCVYIGASAFQGDPLVSISLPVCEGLMDYAFRNCTSLSSIVLPMVSDIRINVFNGCTMLSQITFGYSGVCSLSNSNTFTGTPIAAGTGSIYVPSSLVSDYKAHSVWSYFFNQILPIQESSLAFDSTTGLLYGTASSIYWEFESSLGISLTDILAVSLSQCTSVGAAAFRGCTNLSTVTLDSCDFIGDGAFTSTGLQTLHLGGSNVCQVDSWGPNIDNNTFVSLYVPSSLVTSYETASYWSNFSSKIVPIQ